MLHKFCLSDNQLWRPTHTDDMWSKLGTTQWVKWIWFQYVFNFGTIPSVYIDVGTMAADTATLSFMFLGTDMNFNRQWEIKVTQLEGFNPNK